MGKWIAILLGMMLCYSYPAKADGTRSGANVLSNNSLRRKIQTELEPWTKRLRYKYWNSSHAPKTRPHVSISKNALMAISYEIGAPEEKVEPLLKNILERSSAWAGVPLALHHGPPPSGSSFLKMGSQLQIELRAAGERLPSIPTPQRIGAMSKETLHRIVNRALKPILAATSSKGTKASLTRDPEIKITENALDELAHHMNLDVPKEMLYEVIHHRLRLYAAQNGLKRVELHMGPPRGKSTAQLEIRH
jgi:hypothetical protein